jgi:c-di-GMP-related signal transduction protein
MRTGIKLFQGYYFAKPGFRSLPTVRGFQQLDVSIAG